MYLVQGTKQYGKGVDETVDSGESQQSILVLSDKCAWDFGCMEKEKLSMRYVDDDWAKPTNSLRQSVLITANAVSAASPLSQGDQKTRRRTKNNAHTIEIWRSPSTYGQYNGTRSFYIICNYLATNLSCERGYVRRIPCPRKTPTIVSLCGFSHWPVNSMLSPARAHADIPVEKAFAAFSRKCMPPGAIRPESVRQSPGVLNVRSTRPDGAKPEKDWRSNHLCPQSCDSKISQHQSNAAN